MTIDSCFDTCILPDYNIQIAAIVQVAKLVGK